MCPPYCLIGSTDLTHYGPSYGFEPAGNGPEAVAWMKQVNDKSVVEVLTRLDAKQLLAEASTHYNMKLKHQEELSFFLGEGGRARMAVSTKSTVHTVH